MTAPGAEESQVHDLEAGYAAALDGGSMGDCPYAPADPAGYPWRNGFIQGTAVLRHKAGTYGATPAQIDQARSSLGPAGGDSVAEILGHPSDQDAPTPARRTGQIIFVIHADARAYAAGVATMRHHLDQWTQLPPHPNLTPNGPLPRHAGLRWPTPPTRDLSRTQATKPPRRPTRTRR